MMKIVKDDLKKQVLIKAREYGIQTVLFRNMVAERLGVNVTDMECLGLLFHKGIATPSELAEYTGLSSGATTAMLDRLEKSELIERKPNPHDRRGTYITINKLGASKAAPWFISGRTEQNKLIANYSDVELKVIADFFEKSVTMWIKEREKLQKELKPKG